MACENNKCEKYGLHHDYKDGIEIRKCQGCRRDEQAAHMDKCDRCGSDILMGECSCGIWFEKDSLPEPMKTLERALIDFHKSGKDIASSDHNTGVCCVFFKGDYEKCMNVVKFVEQLGVFIEKIAELKKE